MLQEILEPTFVNILKEFQNCDINRKDLKLFKISEQFFGKKIEMEQNNKLKEKIIFKKAKYDDIETIVEINIKDWKKYIKE